MCFSELFAYNNENFDTGICEIDECFARERKQRAQVITVGDPTGVENTTSDFLEGEVVYQVAEEFGTFATIDKATATAEVIDWKSSESELTIGNITGTFLRDTNTSIKGVESNAERFVLGTENADFFNQINTEDESLQGDNEEIELEIEKDNIIDFSPKDPFSGGNY